MSMQVALHEQPLQQGSHRTILDLQVVKARTPILAVPVQDLMCLDHITTRDAHAQHTAINQSLTE